MRNDGDYIKTIILKPRDTYYKMEMYVNYNNAQNNYYLKECYLHK